MLPFVSRTSLLCLLLSGLLLPACSSSGDAEGSKTAVTTDDPDAGAKPSAKPGNDDGDDTPGDDVEPEPSAASDDDVPEPPDIRVALPPVPMGSGGEGPDAGVEPEPSGTPEPGPDGGADDVEPEPNADDDAEPEPTPEPGMEPEVPPEPTAEPEPGVEPEPMMEPEPSQPQPDPCATRPVCDMTCPAGTVNPVDGSGCVDTCSCEELPDVCQTCDDDEECIEVTASNGDSHVTCAGKIDDCQSLLPCGCLEDYGDCSLGLLSMCQCELPPDPCGGCSDGKRCIYQESGQNGPRFLCASANECRGPEDCECIQQQGECIPDPNRGVCSCSWGGGGF
jgi:hypothetical protein